MKLPARILAGWVALGLVACAPVPERIRVDGGPIEARLVMDRSEAYVGDPIGISIEIDLPAPQRASLPRPESVAQFETDALDALPAFRVAGGMRYAWRWTLRPRVPGVHPLPSVEVPISIPSETTTSATTTSERSAPARSAAGLRREPGSAPGAGIVYAELRTASIPIHVRSVRAQIGEREALFDIRGIPRRPAWISWVIATGLVTALGWASVAMLRSRPGARDGQLERHRAQLLERLRAGGTSISRDQLRELRRELRRFVQLRFGVAGASWTPAELPAAVDAPIRELGMELERACFAREPSGGRLPGLMLAAVQHLEGGPALNACGTPVDGVPRGD